jgi:hypothetical protein
VIDVTIETSGTGFAVSATVRSADTGWEKYADLWEVRGPDGTVLGERVLAHPHVDEQPFTRSVGGVEIPDGVGEVTVAAGDRVTHVDDDHHQSVGTNHSGGTSRLRHRRGTHHQHAL